MKNFLFLFILGTLLAFEVSAENLSREALYYRCYSRLTGDRPSLTDTNLAGLRAGTLDPIDLCLSMLDAAKLNTSSNTRITESTIGTKVLNHLHNVHSTFFGSRAINVPNSNDNQKALNYDIVDPSSPALFFTRALLTDGVRADSIITGKQNLKPIRTNNDPAQGALTLGDKATYAFSVFSENGFSLAPTGELKGVLSAATQTFKYYPLEYLAPPNPLPDLSGEQLYANHCASCHGAIASSTKRNRALATLNKAMTTVTGMKTLNLTAAEINRISMALQDVKTIEFGRSEGAGFLGTHVNLLKTVDQDSAFISNLTAMPRRWATSVYRDAFCRELPVIRADDGASFTVPTSSIPFRTSNSCTQCHASMDRVASTLRGFSYFFLPLNLGNYKVGVHYQISPVTLASETGWPAVEDADYSKRPPVGTLYYRTAIDGSLVNQSVSNIEDLGNKIAQQDDFYICIANRYWNYFTGKGVKMEDQQVMNGYSAVERARFTKIKNLGLGLKSHQSQSLRWLVEQILKSPEFADSGFKD